MLPLLEATLDAFGRARTGRTASRVTIPAGEIEVASDA